MEVDLAHGSRAAAVARRNLDDVTREQIGTVLWFVIVIAVIPWPHVLRRYLLAPGEP